jgi:uncharacterized protein YodC (DUF2158 family)
MGIQEQSDEIKAGDVVILKSGSQKMTVERIQGSQADVIGESEGSEMCAKFIGKNEIAVAALRKVCSNE